MTPLEFLAVVLPSPGHGYYCAVELTTKRKEHVYEEAMEALQPAVDKWDGKDRDIYFALATYAEKGSREAVNTKYLKSLFIDMDGYESKKAAALALNTFLAETGLAALGDPWLVSSGGGIHAYWPLTAEVETAKWKPVAENFKRLCKHKGLSIDMTVTADAARVLRYLGTRNHKKEYGTPREVKLLLPGGSFNFEEIAAQIQSQLPTAQVVPLTVPLAGTRPKRVGTTPAVKLVENSTTLFQNIVDKTNAGSGCGQLKSYMERPSEDGLEPIWRGLLSWTKVCADGEEWSKTLSDMHPYDEQRMLTKLREIKGPYPCTKMDSENPGLCTSCPHWGKVTNPLVFGRVLLTDNTEKVISTPEPASTFEDEFDQDFEDNAHEPVLSVVRPKPPKGFSYGVKGGVYCEKEEKDAQGNKITRSVEILPYDLFVVDVLKQEVDHQVHLVAVRNGVPMTIIMPQKAVVSKDETVKWLASQNIIASYGSGNDANLFAYIRACVAEASLRKPIDVPTQMGWQEDGSFVLNHRVLYKDGTEKLIPMPGLENLNRNTITKGNINGWRKVWNVFIKREMHTLLAVSADTFGSTLMRFTEQQGFVWHIGARKSGTGKSLTLSAKAGVWGHPVRYRTGKGTSPVAMQQRAGLLNCLPLLIDEITATQRANMEWAPAFIFDLSEGQGKERMESGANKERINNSTWGLTCTMTSNTILTDYMSGARLHSSNGELLRMLEWTPNEPLQWNAEERETLKLLNKHYGVAGEMWVRWLVQNQDLARDMVAKVQVKLAEDFKFTDDERYWLAACATTVAAAILLGDKYAGIINLPIKGIVQALKEIVQKARSNFKQNATSAEDVLNAYTRDNYGGFIVIRKAEGKLLASWGDGETVDKSITRSKVLGRVEHGLLQPGFVEYYIEEQLLKRHCVAMSYGYDEFKEQMVNKFLATFVKKDMMSKTNGPSMRVNAIHIRRPVEDHESALSVETPAPR
jgi:hypothetical protein